MLTADYEKAIAQDKVVVFVRDNETERLVSMLFDASRPSPLGASGATPG